MLNFLHFRCRCKQLPPPESLHQVTSWADREYRRVLLRLSPTSPNQQAPTRSSSKATETVAHHTLRDESTR